jgi:hypothetical protein
MDFSCIGIGEGSGRESAMWEFWSLFLEYANGQVDASHIDRRIFCTQCGHEE